MELSNYGVPTAGVTNVPAGGELIRALDLSELLDIAVTDEEAMDTEGYAALLRQATEALSVAPSQCVLFSEGSNAVEAGRSLGLLTIAYGSSRELEAADRRISTFSEVDISELLALGVTV